MIVLSKEQIEEMVDPDQMMDQIEEAYRIYGSGEFYMPPRPTVEHENKQLMYMPCYTKDIIDKDPVDLPGEFQTGTAVDRWYRVTE